MAEICLENLSYRYADAAEDTLAGLNLDVARGEAHALLGGSGAGKSTLLNLLSGLLEMDRGRMLFDGADVAAQSPLQRRVSQVFQFPVLYEDMTVAENLRFPLACAGATRATQRARALDIARRLDLSELLERRAAQLSLVEKQLVAIGKALVRPDVSLVLLDEPLTAAQPAYKWQLRQALKSVQQDLGATMIYVTHDQTEALTFADRISVLHNGRIVQTGSPEELVEQPAHEHVGYFVGSPGMNFLEAEVRDNGYRVIGGIAGAVFGKTAAPPGPCRIGFRPEWATIYSGSAPEGSVCLPIHIISSRILGSWRDGLHGLVTARCQDVLVTTRQPLRSVDPGAGWLCLDPLHVIGFRDGARLVHALG